MGSEMCIRDSALLDTCAAFDELLRPYADGRGAGLAAGTFHLPPLQLRLAVSPDDRAALLLGACDAVGALHERADSVRALVSLLQLPKRHACTARERVCRAALRYGDVHAASAEALWLASEGHPHIWDACEVLAGTAALAGPAAADRRAALLRLSLIHI